MTVNLPEPAARRVALTVSCRDADPIPKVADAGAIKDENGVRVQVMHEGTRIVAGCYHGDWMTEIIRRLRGHHEPQEELAFHHIVQRLREDPSPQPGAIVELGAFWGYYSIWATRALGLRVVLVEPDPGNLDVGRVNLALNGLDARLIQAAVGGAHGSRARLVCESDNVERELPVVTVAGLLEDERLGAIDLLLVDVQGSELDVVERAASLLAAGRIRFVVVSTHHHSISGDPMTHQRCLALLESVGAHVVAEHTVGESFSGDGLIAASLRRSDRDLVVPVSFARYRDSLFGELEPELAAARAQLASADLDRR
jgi:FkbM family methyltransferase